MMFADGQWETEMAPIEFEDERSGSTDQLKMQVGAGRGDRGAHARPGLLPFDGRTPPRRLPNPLTPPEIPSLAL